MVGDHAWGGLGEGIWKIRFDKNTHISYFDGDEQTFLFMDLIFFKRD